MTLDPLTRTALAVPPERLPVGARLPVKIVRDAATLIEAFATDMLADVRRLLAAGRRPIVFVVPVGPVGQFQRLAELCNAQRQSLADLVVVNMDEYLTPEGDYIPIEDPLSFRHHMRDRFWTVLDPALAPPDLHRVFPDPRHPEETTKLIDRLGGVDVCYGGVGITGHVAFNDPPEPDEPDDVEAFAALPTRVVRLSRESILINSVTAARGNRDRIPPDAVTVGMKEILASRTVRLYLNRPWQCAVVRKLLHGPVTARVPVTLLQRHPDAHVTLTEEVTLLPEPQLR